MSLSSLPDVALHQIAAFLSAPDVLHLLSIDRDAYSVGTREAFWKALLSSQFGDNDYNGINDNASTDDSARDVYTKLSYRQVLPCVEWKAIATNQHTPAAREGHLSCILGNRYLVITGGYSHDSRVHVKDLQSNQDFVALIPTLQPSLTTLTTPTSSKSSSRSAGSASPAETRIPLCFAYGASLTPLNDRQAVRFGGFRSGGYASECGQVAILTIQAGGGDDEDEDDGEGRSLSATWQVVQATTVCDDDDEDFLHSIDDGGDRGMGVSRILSTRTRSGRSLLADHRAALATAMENYLARAYHTATLLAGRYLLILGGMQTSNSIWNPAILDTWEWKWHFPPSRAALRENTLSDASCATRPSSRHGHSAIWDAKRSRIVLFGGGSGGDLLRSGRDNTEVWECRIRFNNIIGDDSSPVVEKSLVEDVTNAWRRLIPPETIVNDDNSNNNNNNLSPAETLCLGRCHVSHRVAPDTVLLAFGSGRPSTNGVLAYNLARDSFFRPQVWGPLPCPRFTAASALWESNSYVIFHGGFTTQRSTSMGDMHLLDLAPALRRPPPRGVFNLVDPRGAPYYLPVTDGQVLELRQ